MFKIGPIVIVVSLTTIAGVIFVVLSGGIALVAVDNFTQALFGIPLGLGGLGTLLIILAVASVALILFLSARSHV